MISERIKHLRKDVLKMTQEDFASKINLSRSNFGNIEVGRIAATDRVISDIAKAFGISETWLRDGVGEMFESKVNSDSEYLANILGEVLSDDIDPVRVNLIKLNLMLIKSLPDDVLPDIESYILDIANSIKNKKGGE